MMREFRIRENGFAEIRKRILRRTIPFSMVGMIVGVSVVEVIPTSSPISPWELAWILLLLCGAWAYGTARTLKRSKAIYQKYVIAIDETGIARMQDNAPLIKIAFPEIRKIARNKWGDHIVTGNSKMNSIVIPSQLENFDELEGELKRITGITIQPLKSMAQWLIFPFMVLLFVLMGIVYYSHNTILVGTAGTLLSAFIVWSFVMIQRNKNLDKRTKRSSYLMIILLLSIIGMTISKFLIIY